MTWNEAEDQIPGRSGTLWCDPADGDARLKGCSDLLEDFLKTISEMESEFLSTLDGAR
ncbi:MAG: hypothetical protein LBV60_16275 [Streptomyces sp.]|nr:hypothetical protein [Streptomyces sp.]